MKLATNSNQLDIRSQIRDRFAEFERTHRPDRIYGDFFTGLWR